MLIQDNGDRLLEIQFYKWMPSRKVWMINEKTTFFETEATFVDKYEGLKQIPEPIEIKLSKTSKRQSSVFK